MAGATIWDFGCKVIDKYGAVGIMLIAVTFMYYNSLQNQKEQHAQVVSKLSTMERKLDMVQYQVNDMEKDVDKLMAREEDVETRDGGKYYSYHLEVKKNEDDTRVK